MEITVNTSTDSHDHIRKVIDLLRNLVGEQASSSNSSGSSSSDAASPFAGMFGDSAPAPELPSAPVQMDIPPAAPTQPQSVDIWGNPKKPDPGIEVY